MPKTDTYLQAPEDKGPAQLPSSLEPLMLAHLVLTGDSSQQAEWRSRLEAIRQADAVAAAPDPETRAILANKAAWSHMRATGKLGTIFGLGVLTFWMAWLLPTYAVGWGFGWIASLAFLLPVPIAWKFGRKLWEQAALSGMRDLGERPSLKKRMRVAFRSMARSFNAGFGFGFSLVFLQTLITWFFTPAPTLAAELLSDAYHGSVAGLITGLLGMMLAPLVGRSVPTGETDGSGLLGAGAPLALAEETD